MKKPNIIALDNESLRAVGVQPTFDRPERYGQVALANDALFQQETVVEEISNWAIGYADPYGNELAKLRDFIAPRRASGRNAYVTVFDESEPFKAVDLTKTIRQPLGSFAEVRQMTSTKVLTAIPNYGLTVKLDMDQMRQKPDWQQRHAAWLINLLMRAEILSIMASYTAAASAVALNWDAASNPDLDLQDINVNVLAPSTGFKANRACYGEAASLKRLVAYGPQRGAAGFAGYAAQSDAEIATKTGLSQVMTNAERYQQDDGTKATFLGSKVLLFTGVAAENPSDPTNIARYVANAWGGGEYAVHVLQEGVKNVWLTVEGYSLPVVQHTSGLVLATVA